MEPAEPQEPETEFGVWVREWMNKAHFTGTTLPDPEQRIADVVELWGRPIPGSWQRSLDRPRLLDPAGYGRSRKNEPRGEYVVEHEVLGTPLTGRGITCLGGELVDGVNAVPLTRDEGGGRTNNVEADMLLLARTTSGAAYNLFLVEAKVASDNAWYATVENLRQLRLFLEADEMRRLFHVRQPELDLPESLPVTGVVLAPEDFYTARGQKRESVVPAQRLLERMRADFDLDVQLAVWAPPEMKPL